MINWTQLVVFIAFFLLITILGFVAARWRRGDLRLLNEWGLAGRRFGTVVTWFLLGGDFYTAYTVIAVPALVYGVGALGFFALPYTIIVYPIVFVLMPRLWSVCRRRGYVTPADFVRGRYGSSLLALAVALTGILAVMPYIALQLVGIQVVLDTMGLRGTGFAAHLPLILAFAILAAFTYTSGLRAPAMIAVVKDTMIYIMVLAAITLIPLKLGGYGHVFGVAERALAQRQTPGAIILAPKLFVPYASLALGSAMAAFMYPHTITGVLSSFNGHVIRRNAAILPAYTFLLGLIAMLGYMTIAAGVHPNSPSLAVPQLFARAFPAWFSGFAFAAIAIGALVPAAIMSIAAANLFTRNIYVEYSKRTPTSHQEAVMAKNVSLIIKLGALAFIIFLPTQYAINLQLLGGIWILQTFPAIAIGLFTRWLHHLAVLVGWLCGMVAGTLMVAASGFTSSVYTLKIGSVGISAYAALDALALNLIITVVLTLVFDVLSVRRARDDTSSADYELEDVGSTQLDVSSVNLPQSWTERSTP